MYYYIYNIYFGQRRSPHTFHYYSIRALRGKVKIKNLSILILSEISIHFYYLYMSTININITVWLDIA